MALKKPSGGSGKGTSPELCVSAGLLSRWPSVWEFLTEATYEDGSRRELPTLMLFVHDGRLTGALNDRDNQRTAFVSGTTPEAILDALAAGLITEDVQWRPNRPLGGKKKF